MNDILDLVFKIEFLKNKEANFMIEIKNNFIGKSIDKFNEYKNFLTETNNRFSDQNLFSFSIKQAIEVTENFLLKINQTILVNQIPKELEENLNDSGSLLVCIEIKRKSDNKNFILLEFEEKKGIIAQNNNIEYFVVLFYIFVLLLIMWFKSQFYFLYLKEIIPIENDENNSYRFQIANTIYEINNHERLIIGNLNYLNLKHV